MKSVTLYNIPHLDNYYITKFGNVVSKKSNQIIKPNRFSNKKGFYVILSQNNIKQEYSINWILMNVFYGITGLKIIEEIHISNYSDINSKNLHYDDSLFYEIPYNTVTSFIINEMEYRLVPETNHYLFINKEGAVYSFYQMKFIRRSYGHLHEYPHISPLISNTKRYYSSIHRMLGQTWLSDFSPELVVNHIDTKKYNSWVGNLEMITPIENIRHAFDNNLKSYRVTTNQIHKVCQMMELDYTLSVILSELDHHDIISIEQLKNLIYRIMMTDKWKDIREMYNIEHWRYDTHYNTVYSKKDIHKVCQLLQDHYEYSNKHISELIGIPSDSVQAIRSGKQWLDISKKYNIAYTKERVHSLDDEIVHKICKMLENGTDMKEISEKTDVSYTKICEIHRGFSHTNISSQYDIEYNKPRSLTKMEVEKICEMIIDGDSNTEISKVFDISGQTVADIRKGKTWSEISKKHGIPIKGLETSPNKRYYMTQEMVDEVIKLLSETTLTYVDIGKKMEIPAYTVKNYKNKYNIIRPTKNND